jgi:radical SAM superfamily enzyme YgiQ (UPF0313 family)
MQTRIVTLGQLHVITHLERSGYPCKCVYLTKRGKKEEEEQREDTEGELNSILGFIEHEKPDLIGLSLMTLNFFRTRRLTRKIKNRFPELPVLWGGVHPTFNPEESIEHADYVCLGEGEDATLELVQTLEKSEITENLPNIWMKKDGRVIKNDVRPLIQNLDAYPFPKINWSSSYCLDEGAIKPLTQELYKKYVHYNGTMYDVIITRGCPFTCNYCCNSLLRQLYKNKGKYIRYRSVDNVIAELRYIKKNFPYTRIINIQDDSFADAPEKYLKEFSEKYRYEVGLPLRLRMIPTQVNKTKMEYLVRANTMSIIIGLQANDRINKTVFNRHISSETFLKVARLIKKYNIVGEYQLIGQNPYAKEEDMVEICEILAQIPKPYRLQILHLGLFPNTVLREKAIRDGIRVNELDGYAYSYGAYPEKFPLLRSIQELAPQTPKFLILFFLKHRKSVWGRLLLDAYRVFYFYSLQRLKKIVIHNSFLVLLARKILFFPVTFRRFFTDRNKTPLRDEDGTI